MELDMPKTSEELTRVEKKEEKTEKMWKEGGGRREVAMAVAVEIIRRNEEEVVRPVKKDGEDRNLRMRDQDIILTSTRLETSQHANTKATDNTSPSPR